jgi:hypothetical protein
MDASTRLLEDPEQTVAWLKTLHVRAREIGCVRLPGATAIPSRALPGWQSALPWPGMAQLTALTAFTSWSSWAQVLVKCLFGSSIWL